MSESQTPRINAQAYWHEDKHVVDYETAFEIEKELLAELTATRARFAKIEEAARADEADLNKMRDGTKLTRAGLVMVLKYLQEDNKDLRARLAELEGIAEELCFRVGCGCGEYGTCENCHAASEKFEAYKEGKK